MYNPLKITTEYTLLNSMIKVKDLVTFLTMHDFTAAGIVDTNLYGAMNFYNEMTSHNIKPIIGLDIKLNDLNIYLYAKNYEGFKNLLKINTLIENNNISIDNLKKYNKNIILVIPVNSLKLYDELKDIYKDIFVSYSNEEEKKAAFLKTNNVLYLNDVRALTKEDTKYLNYIRMIDEGKTISEFDMVDYQNNYLKLDNEVSALDRETTINFANLIDIKIPKDNIYIPKYDTGSVDSYTYLANLTKKGLYKRLNNNVSDTYINRLKKELQVIKDMGFVDYFLIVYDYVLFSKKNNILVGPGRGSAAGSLVSYTLGITEIDPIKYNLLFERFLNPERISMPDIDIDFEDSKRQDVIDYVKSKYGENNVAPIMTFGTLGAKQVVRDLGRILKIDNKLINKLADNIDSKESLKTNFENITIKKFINNYPELKELFKIGLKIEGYKRHISTHAAGVVICSNELDEVIPVCKSGDILLTGYTMEYLEELGLLKMDFLALRNLSIISNILKLIKDNKGEEIDLRQIPLDDKLVYDLFTRADTEGVFQFESNGMKNLMSKLKPRCFSDLVASVALFRPGPMQNIDSFIKRKNGLEKIDYLDPSLEPILKETYGIIVYQEQIMQILVKLAKYSYAEADNIRRAMSKKKLDVMEKERTSFIKRSVENGYKEDLAIKVYDLIIKFANYGFNKAHSVSYAYLGYQMAYLKTYYKEYFLINLLNMCIGSEIKTKEYLDEVKMSNLSIVAPSINKSSSVYILEDNKVVLPLNIIKNLGTSLTGAIINEREDNGAYTDFFDFISRTYYKGVNKKVIESLIDAGVFKEFNYNNKTLKENIDIGINYATLIKDLDESLVSKPSVISYEEDKDIDSRMLEYNSYGFYISNHPASKYNDSSIVKLNNIKNYFDKNIKLVVLVEKINKIKTKNNEDMAFFDASDETSRGDFVIFPKANHLITEIKKGDLVVVHGRVTKRFDKYQISVNAIIKNK